MSDMQATCAPCSFAHRSNSSSRRMPSGRPRNSGCIHQTCSSAMRERWLNQHGMMDAAMNPRTWPSTTATQTRPTEASWRMAVRTSSRLTGRTDAYLVPDMNSMPMSAIASMSCSVACLTMTVDLRLAVTGTDFLVRVVVLRARIDALPHLAWQHLGDRVGEREAERVSHVRASAALEPLLDLVL